ncbi:MAG: RDD family protein [Ghiorsea sp.]
MSDTAPLKARPVNITTRIFSAVYDIIMLFAVTFIFVGFSITAIETTMDVEITVWVKNLLFTSVAFAYYVGFWHKGDGATTGMRPWKLRVINIQTGKPPSLLEASIRFVIFGSTLIALVATMLYLKTGETHHIFFIVSSLIPVVSMLCMLFSPKRQPLHDLIAGTNVYRVLAPSKDKVSP